ncbi:lamin tail domain-containing protein [Haloarchaeobius litoreus]|uniref:Lamin tail domain-containing protein n=1 Tax=Haloarchaeobius litoreus TaxID=755306 RepID=A0ABD6DMM6_9EURY|nr:lamin tail domain-containing protein [Haloarchaeobius litoreus]
MSRLDSFSDKLNSARNSRWRFLLYLIIVFVLLPVVLFLLPFMVAGAIATNYREAAHRLSFLPGISETGGVVSGVVAFVYTFIALSVFGAVLNLGDSPETTASNQPAATTVAPAATTQSALAETDTNTPAQEETTSDPPATTATTPSTPTPTPTRTTVRTASTPTTTAVPTPSPTPTTTAVPTQTPTPTPTTTTAATTIAGGGSDDSQLSISVHEDAIGDEYDNLDDEYVTLTNTGESTLDLSMWQIKDIADHTYTIPRSVTLAPGESVTLYTGHGTDTDTELYWGRDAPVWNNNGDTVFVFDTDGELVAEHTYG